MIADRYKVWYRANGKTISVYVDAVDFVEASLTAEKRLSAEITKIIHYASGLEDHQLEKYKKLQADCYKQHWFGYGDSEKERKATENRIDFEYKYMPNLEYVNEIQHQLYIPPYRLELLPEHLKEVALKYDKTKSHSGNE